MKLFVVPKLFNTTPISKMLQRIGIESGVLTETGPYNGSIMISPRDLYLINAEQITTLLQECKFNAAEHLRSVLNLPGSKLIEDKWFLHQKLVELNLSHIPTIFPTSLSEIEHFFNEHGAVFCKPRIGSSSVASSLDIFQQIRMCTKDDISDSTIHSLTDNIPTPTTTTHFYKKYTNYQDFIDSIDVNNFLNVQQNGILTHQCVLQKDFTQMSMSWDHCTFFGYVNSEQQVYLEKYVIQPRTYIEVQDVITPQEFTSYTNNNASVQNRCDFNSWTIEDISDILSNRYDKQNDILGAHEILTNLAEAANVRSSSLCVQGYYNDGIFTIFDVSTTRDGIIFRKPWFTDTHIQSRLNFCYGSGDLADVVEDNKYSLYFEFYAPQGLDVDKLQWAKNNGITFFVPVQPGVIRAPCFAYSDDINVLATNVKSFLNFCG